MFVSLTDWWEVGKAQIRVFCCQYTSYSRGKIKNAIHNLEKYIKQLESNICTDFNNDDQLKQNKDQLSRFLHERAKGALVRSRFASIKDIDAPYHSSLIWSEKSVRQSN